MNAIEGLTKQTWQKAKRFTRSEIINYATLYSALTLINLGSSGLALKYDKSNGQKLPDLRHLDLENFARSSAEVLASTHLEVPAIAIGAYVVVTDQTKRPDNRLSSFGRRAFFRGITLAGALGSGYASAMIQRPFRQP